MATNRLITLWMAALTLQTSPLLGVTADGKQAAVQLGQLEGQFEGMSSSSQKSTKACGPEVESKMGKGKQRTCLANDGADQSCPPSSDNSENGNTGKTFWQKICKLLFMTVLIALLWSGSVMAARYLEKKEPTEQEAERQKFREARLQGHTNELIRSSRQGAGPKWLKPSREDGSTGNTSVEETISDKQWMFNEPKERPLGIEMMDKGDKQHKEQKKTETSSCRKTAKPALTQENLERHLQKMEGSVALTSDSLAEHDARVGFAGYPVVGFAARIRRNCNSDFAFRPRDKPWNLPQKKHSASEVNFLGATACNRFNNIRRLPSRSYQQRLLAVQEEGKMAVKEEPIRTGTYKPRMMFCRVKEIREEDDAHRGSFGILSESHVEGK